MRGKPVKCVSSASNEPRDTRKPQRARVVRKLELAAGGNHLILGAYTNMRVAIVVTDVGRRGEGELQQHRQQAAKK